MPRSRMLYFFLASLSALLLASAQADGPVQLDTARAYIGTVEVGNNRGPKVERFLASVHLGPGNPWCAAFVSYCLTAARRAEPRIRSGLARAFITGKSIDARKVLRGAAQVPRGSLVIWRRGSGMSGHIGFVDTLISPREIRTIEGNTSSGEAGSQYNGDGVYERVRAIQPGNYFRIVAFTRVK